MSYQEIIEKIKPELDKAQESFKNNLMEIRAGRLSTALIEDIKVECFGQVLPLKQLGAISTSSSKEILVQLWDESYVEAVVKAIEKRNLGLGVRIEGNSIYLSAPPLTEDSKKNLVKVLNQKKEETFQTIRRIRDRAWKEIQDAFQKKEIGEDDKYKGKDKLEDLIRETREEIEELVENKRKEIED